MTLSSLIEQCLKGDRVSQRQLYDNYKDNLYTTAYRLMSDFDQSSDLLQETFIEAFKQLANLRQPEYFHSWIKQILVRKAYRLLKKQKEDISLDSVGELSYQDNSDIGYIEQAIQKLPAKSRTVFVMTEIEGFSHKEIAEVMNISVGTSKSQLNYAKTKLRELLKHHMI